MRMTDRDSRPECAIIPFQRPDLDHENVTTTSIAAVIAVTILHTDAESAEDKLLALIEATGEAEVLDADDALMALDECALAEMPDAINDNNIVTLA